MSKPTTDTTGDNKSVVTPTANTVPRTVDSHELLGAQGMLYIRHQNEVYRLQTTRFSKLILTK
jgi:hemin uptake protein HemP